MTTTPVAPSDATSYQLKEADLHTWAIPRLAGRSKAALVSIQAERLELASSVDRRLVSTRCTWRPTLATR